MTYIGSRTMYFWPKRDLFLNLTSCFLCRLLAQRFNNWTWRNIKLWHKEMWSLNRSVVCRNMHHHKSYLAPELGNLLWLFIFTKVSQNWKNGAVGNYQCMLCYWDLALTAMTKLGLQWYLPFTVFRLLIYTTEFYHISIISMCFHIFECRRSYTMTPCNPVSNHEKQSQIPTDEHGCCPHTFGLRFKHQWLVVSVIRMWNRLRPGICAIL